MNTPEHSFTPVQIATLLKLLGIRDLNSNLRKEYLLGAARWFTSELVLQNCPTHSQIDRRLERIESAVSRLQHALRDPVVKPYMRMAAGDVLKDDRSLDTAIDATETLGRWALQAQDIVARNKEHERSEDARRKALALPGQPWRRPTKSAMRVLVHRLAMLWLHTHRGVPPTRSVNSPFFKFVQSYLKAMRAQTTEQHRLIAPSVCKELCVSDDVIGEHLKAFRARLKPKAK